MRLLLVFLLTPTILLADTVGDQILDNQREALRIQQQQLQILQQDQFDEAINEVNAIHAAEDDETRRLITLQSDVKAARENEDIFRKEVCPNMERYTAENREKIINIARKLKEKNEYFDFPCD